MPEKERLCFALTIFLAKHMTAWASEGLFFREEPLWHFYKSFPNGVKSGELGIFLLETTKTTFFADIFKIQGGPWLPSSLPRFRRPCMANDVFILSATYSPKIVLKQFSASFLYSDTMTTVSNALVGIMPLFRFIYSNF